MPYRIEWKPSALREFKKLPPGLRNTIERKIELLADNPRPDGCRKLAGLETAYRLRLGDYRLVYEVDDQIILVHILRIRHRRESYRGL